MAKYKLVDWEENGYDDSDFYGVYFDTEDGKIHKTMIGSTRFGGCGYYFGEEYLIPTKEILEKVEALMVEILFELYKKKEEFRINNPFVHIQKNVGLILDKDHSFFRKGAVKCNRCENGTYMLRNGSGTECFRCKGLGFIKNREFIKNESGKRTKGLIPKGTHVMALSSPKFYGTYYPGGYNKPHRHNTTVPVALFSDVDDHVEVVYIPTEKLILDVKPKSDEQWMTVAKQCASFHDDSTYAEVFGCRAWLSSNWASQVKYEKGE